MLKKKWKMLTYNFDQDSKWDRYLIYNWLFSTSTPSILVGQRSIAN